MKHTEPLDEKKRRITHCLSCLPRKMLQLHGRENVIEFVLHEIGKPECFNLQRAAYVIDNPDFNCLRGVAGYCKQEAYTPKKDIWEEKDLFSEHMGNAAYNKKVRCFEKESCVKKGEKDEQIVKEISSDLGFENPSFYAWGMKHDNHGLLIYEKDDDEECDCDHLIDGLSLIGFCPVF